MTSTLIPVLNELTEYEKLNVIDVGSARASFIIELKKVYKKEVFSIGIDAEGKDLHIVKSLKEHTLSRVVFIAIECTRSSPRFEDEYTKDQCISYFESIGFDMHYCYDTDNGSGISDVVFKNRSIS